MSTTYTVFVVINVHGRCRHPHTDWWLSQWWSEGYPDRRQLCGLSRGNLPARRTTGPNFNPASHCWIWSSHPFVGMLMTHEMNKMGLNHMFNLYILWYAAMIIFVTKFPGLLVLSKMFAIPTPVSHWGKWNESARKQGKARMDQRSKSGLSKTQSVPRCLCGSLAGYLVTQKSGALSQTLPEDI